MLTHDLFEHRAGRVCSGFPHDAHVRFDEVAAVEDRQAARLELVEHLLQRLAGEFRGERNRRRCQQRYRSRDVRQSLHWIMIVPSASTSWRRSVVANMTANA